MEGAEKIRNRKSKVKKEQEIHTSRWNSLNLGECQGV